MLANLMVTGKYNIGIKKDKVTVGDETVSIKEIPFIRYRLGSYGEEEIQYIKKMKSKFDASLPLVEFELKDDSVTEISLFDEEDDMVKYLRVEITNENTKANTLGDWIITKLGEVADSGIPIDSVVLVDKSDDMKMTHIIKFREEIKQIMTTLDDVSVCNSPFSFGEEACLTAIKARRLLAYYSEKDECAIPSSRHECMECCVSHLEVSSDISVTTPEKDKIKSKKDNSNSKEKVKKSDKKPVLLDW